MKLNQTDPLHVKTVPSLRQRFWEFPFMRWLSHPPATGVSVQQTGAKER
jgi:hypothetical protein